MPVKMDLPGRIQPAPIGGGFAMDGYWVWCGSVIRGDDGRYHMFASRWPGDEPYLHWAVRSEIVRASSDTPEGPFTFEQVVLGARDGVDAFDARMAHNPAITRCGDTYLLFYTGSTFDGPTPSAGDPAWQPDRRWQQSWHNKRIGLAIATSIAGPWTRPTEPVLPVNPDGWDSVITSNAAPCVHADGSVLLLYKSCSQPHDPDGRFRGRFRLGAAWADHDTRPFRRLGDQPVLRFDHPDAHVEDPFCWHDGRIYRAIMKDMTGVIGGEAGAGIAAESADGRHWRLSEPVRAYSRRVRWADGTITTPAKLERPQLLLRDGRPTHLYLATCDSETGLADATRTWCMVMPLAARSGG
ncbi:MAG: glycoside hydrolase family protein [Planctomycetota bacterium]